MSEKFLNMPSEERDALYDWLMQHAPRKIQQEVRGKPERAAKWASIIPERIVGKYAIGDVQRTHKLNEFFSRELGGAGMQAAYDVERRLLPITLDMEHVGVRLDRKRLEVLRGALTVLVADQDRKICKKLGKSFNVSSGDELGEVLTEKGKLKCETLTPGGKQSTARDVLISTCRDKKLVELLNVRELADKYLGTFVSPWLMRLDGNDYIHPTFNQVRNRDADIAAGTRTGRLSSSRPNFQQVPAGGEESRNALGIAMLAHYLTQYGIEGFTGLRAYVLPDPGTKWAAIDYSQQELRFLAHFVGGKLAEAYRKNPKMDVHSWFRDEIRAATGRDYTRKAVKTIVFGIIYGMGLLKLAASLGITPEEAAELRASMYLVVPELRELSRSLSKQGEISKGGVRTWGGRRYFTEEAWVNEDTNEIEREFGYKNLNIVIQGSSADLTKRAMLAVRDLDAGRLALQIHDELAVMVASKKDAQRVAAAMCDFEGLNVPFLADIKMSARNWGAVR